MTGFCGDPADYVSGYRQLSPLGVSFYPIRRDKSPAVSGKLDRVATIDPLKIKFWVEHCHHRSFAARILRRSRLMVIDTEHPFKHPERPGPDGEMFLGSLLEDSDIELPTCPMVQTASEGGHRYLLIPKGFCIRPTVGLWPGIDVLTAGSSVILPGSRTESGEYRAIRSFEECSIPEAPRAFLKLIRTAQRVNHSPPQPRPSVNALMTEADTSEVSRRQWWLLFKNRVFRSFWKRQGKLGDATDSAYEYHLAKSCFCCGLNHRQTEFVVTSWRRKHGLTRDLRQLRLGIIPKAWCEVEPWVRQWIAERDAAEQARKASKTSNLILLHVRSKRTPQTPASIAAALSIPRDRAKKSMQRMATKGMLVRTPEGYVLGRSSGTFQRITTPNSGMQTM